MHNETRGLLLALTLLPCITGLATYGQASAHQTGVRNPSFRESSNADWYGLFYEGWFKTTVGQYQQGNIEQQYLQHTMADGRTCLAFGRVFPAGIEEVQTSLGMGPTHAISELELIPNNFPPYQLFSYSSSTSDPGSIDARPSVGQAGIRICEPMAGARFVRLQFDYLAATRERAHPALLAAIGVSWGG